MIRLTEDTETFAARRRSAQHRLEKELRPSVTRALDLDKDTDGWDEVLAKVAQLYKTAYADESGFYAPPIDRAALDGIHDTLKATDRTEQPNDLTVDRITVWLATAILSLSTMQAALDDPEELFLEWVDMHDESVRKAHRDASGQQRPVGEKFNVGGHAMVMPGDSSAPMDLWINCRCTLRPVLAREALTAAGHCAPSETVYSPPLDGADAPHWTTLRDVSRDERKKAAKEGRALPDGSFPIANCQDLRNAIQAIGRAKDPAKAKAHIRKRKRALGCPDVELPDTWATQVGTAENYLRVDDDGNTVAEVSTEPTHAGMAVYAADTARVLMIQRSLDQSDDPEVRGTWEFPGGTIEEGESPEEAAWREFCEETGLPQPAGEMTGGWRSPNGVYQGFVWTTPVESDAFPELNPDADGAHMVNPDDPQRREPDVSAWFTIEQIKGLGTALRPEVHDTDWSVFESGDEMPETETYSSWSRKVDEKIINEWSKLPHFSTEVPPEDTPEDEECVERDEEGNCVDPAEPINDEPGKKAPTPEQAVPFHAVLAVEGVKTGDGRRFTPGSLSHRPLPLPLTWQKVSAKEHDGNVVVARIEKIKVHEGQQLATGHFIQGAEADEFIGLVAEFGRFGVSIDGDMVVGEVNEEEECVDFTATRTSSACAVPIPALAEAWVSLGEAPDDWPMDEPDEQVEPLVAAGISFKDLAPGRTEDGPGWLTNPVDTDRLRDYWVRGPGAAKIGWGTPGDFNRCRAAVAEYVMPQHLAGYCANRHYDALGFWPGRPVAGETTPFAYESLHLTDTEPAPMFNLTASGGIKAPAEWFANPNFQMGDERLVEQESGGYAVPFTVTEEGRVFGHIAHWGSCHINPAFAGYCVDPPRSNTAYAYFRTGAVLLDDGTMAATGVISIGGGHAGERLTAKQALAHYDNTSTAACDVACYDDDFGIAVAGWIRPGTSDEMVTAVRASKISGDWRPIGTNPLELVAALAVNVPGFGVNRTRIAAGSEGQISLVAAGMVDSGEETKQTRESIDLEALAYEVALQVEGIQMRKAEMAALAARRERQD